MKPGRFTYHRPDTIEECVRLLAEFKDEAAVIAGGQSLVPLLRFRLASPSHIVSIRGLKNELGAVRAVDGGVAIGACATYVAVQRAPEVMKACPDLQRAIELVAHPAVRTRGTVCGNMCQADPASQLPALALVTGARFTLRSVAGARTVEAADFFLGPYTTARRSDEVLTEAFFPNRSDGEKISVKEVTRLRGGFPLAGIAAAITPGEGTRLRSVALACFGVNSTQIRLREAEAALTANGYTPEGISAAADAIDRAIQPHSDSFASESYRRSAARSLFRRAMEEIYERTRVG